uniref:Uncharacterized protein n=1 Tax=Helicotheca tamesis TaxID=374047 RepID=A0A6U0FIE0_9STRA|mmetsp:Transcript_15275/g.20872  ORF Transcript_15275/g.20872 Transcript_15275/m.20872 type:complete len:179 (+) Transcript_15275:226-762(+)
MGKTPFKRLSNAISGGAKAVGDGAKAVGSTVGDGAKAVGSGAKSVGSTVGDGAKSVGSTVGGAVGSGAKKVGSGARKVSDSAKSIGGGVVKSNGGSERVVFRRSLAERSLVVEDDDYVELSPEAKGLLLFAPVIGGFYLSLTVYKFTGSFYSFVFAPAYCAGKSVQVALRFVKHFVAG